MKSVVENISSIPASRPLPIGVRGDGARGALPRGGSPGWVAGVGRRGESPGLPEPGVGRGAKFEVVLF